MTTNRPPLTIAGRALLGSAPAGNVSVRFPPELRQQLQAHARAKHVAAAEVIRRAVRDYLDRTQAS